MEKTEFKPKDKRVLSLFIVSILSLILIGVGYVDQAFLRIGLQLLVFLLQFVVIKSILDDYYKYTI